MNDQKILQDTKPLAGKEVDKILMYSTHYKDIKENLENIKGWRGKIKDDFRRVLVETCMALELRGLDGRRR